MNSTAPIYSLSEEAAHAESSVWNSFSSARDTAEFCRSWLAILCTQVGRVGGALLLLGPNSEGAFTPAAIWPHARRDVQYLSPAAERTITERRGIVIAPDGTSAVGREQRAYVGYPIVVAGVLHGVVVLDVAPGPDLALQRALRLLHWASAWLIDRFQKRALEEQDARLLRLAIATDLVATAIQERRAVSAALAVANEMAARLACDRVSIGFERSGSVEVKAISHTATFDPKMNLARRICEAMDEVLELDGAAVFPPLDDEGAAIAHGELAREFQDVAACSVPLVDDGHTMGVLTLERSTGALFDAETVGLLKTIGELLGPILEMKRENERSVRQRAFSAMRAAAEVLVGPRHPGAKLIAIVIAGVLLFASLATGTFRISGKTVVEGSVQRVLAAPFDGYIVQSSVRAGDTVRQGDGLARLDERDLKLEKARISSEREQLVRKHRQALATKDRASMAVISAQIDEADAALSLTNDKLARATLTAPFDGVVVAGDLSQLLGTPVEQGKMLFQIAPLDTYRVILEVDERDIGNVTAGQDGDLTLSGIPNQRMEFKVQQITPISTTQDGRNFFRVEAHLETPPGRVRPGMEGVGKIVVGDRKLIWIWMHGIIDWLRLLAWKWLP